eukprot:CAMPEP_0177632530 /NCGR_PEP_ID=MMETSP0447-20121125/2347_1 /TAXON_ID=0 /ORGANISM="Stygamoeba regulata, Strain BSH-02190019" /LENGTH=767 /DNA_ID=CAMNT_0019134117 /DNA_START=118 /DNA_END=2417 /DNA_ORIENTATION=-
MALYQGQGLQTDESVDFLDFADYSSDDAADAAWALFEESTYAFAAREEGWEPDDVELEAGKIAVQCGIKEAGTRLSPDHSWVCAVLMTYAPGRQRELQCKTTELNSLIGAVQLTAGSAHAFKFRVLEPSDVHPAHSMFPVVTLRFQLPTALLVQLTAPMSAAQAEAAYPLGRVAWETLAAAPASGLLAFQKQALDQILNEIFGVVEASMPSATRFKRMCYPRLLQELTAVSGAYAVFAEKTFADVLNKSPAGTLDQLALYYNPVTIAVDTTAHWTNERINDLNRRFDAINTMVASNPDGLPYATLHNFPSESESGVKGPSEGTSLKVKRVAALQGKCGRRLFLCVHVYYRHMNKFVSEISGTVSSQAVHAIVDAWGGAGVNIEADPSKEAFLAVQASSVRDFLLEAAQPLTALIRGSLPAGSDLTTEPLNCGGVEFYVSEAFSTRIQGDACTALCGYADAPPGVNVFEDLGKMETLLVESPPRALQVDKMLSPAFGSSLIEEVNTRTGSALPPTAALHALEYSDWKTALQRSAYHPLVLLLRVAEAAWDKDTLPQIVSVLRLSTFHDDDGRVIGPFDGTADIPLGTVAVGGQALDVTLYNAKFKSLRSGHADSAIERLVPYIQLRFFVPKSQLPLILEDAGSPEELTVVGSMNTVSLRQHLVPEITQKIVLCVQKLWREGDDTPGEPGERALGFGKALKNAKASAKAKLTGKKKNASGTGTGTATGTKKKGILSRARAKVASTAKKAYKDIKARAKGKGKSAGGATG